MPGISTITFHVIAQVQNIDRCIFSNNTIHSYVQILLQGHPDRQGLSVFPRTLVESSQSSLWIAFLWVVNVFLQSKLEKQKEHQL